jgi:endoglycosylceramidase
MRRHLIRLALAALPLAGCDETATTVGDAATALDAPSPDAPAIAECAEVAGPFAPLSTRCGQLVDAQGRVVVVHGVNARVDGVFDVALDMGRAPLQPIPPFTADDAAAMRALGFNVLRLPMQWSGVEPTDGAPFDAAYLDRVAAVVDLARAAGLLVLLDLHQDAYSKEIGEDGAPRWAIVPAPDTLLGGPLVDLGARRTSAQVLRAFATFFGDSAEGDRLRARYARMAAAVATRFRGNPGVLGYEVFNEPVAVESQVLRLNTLVARAMREADPGHLIAFEPDSTGRLASNRSARARERFPVAGALYAPHTYPLAFTGTPAQLAAFTVEDLRGATESARTEADLWGAPLLVTEWGYDPRGTRSAEYHRFMQDLQAEYQAGEMYWVWKERSQGSWGLHDYDAVTDTWRQRAEARRMLARVRPEAIAGEPVRWSYDAGARRFALTFVARADRSGPHRVYVPAAEDFAASFEVRCDGALVAADRDPRTGTIDVGCGGASGAHTITVEGR